MAINGEMQDQGALPLTTFKLEVNNDQKKSKIPINPEIKVKLIQSVVRDHLPIYQAAIIHKVKYSTAKHILRNYTSDTINFLADQRKRKQKIICKNISLLIDKNSGDVTLHLDHFQRYQNSEIQSQVEERLITLLSNSFTKHIQKEKHIFYYQVNNLKEENAQISQHINEQSYIEYQCLEEILIQQHLKMKS